jgi:hypothetical protein
MAVLDSLGSVVAPASNIPLVSDEKKILVYAITPTDVRAARLAAGCSVVIDPAQTLTEITTRNNAVTL